MEYNPGGGSTFCSDAAACESQPGILPSRQLKQQNTGILLYCPHGRVSSCPPCRMARGRCLRARETCSMNLSFSFHSISKARRRLLKNTAPGRAVYKNFRSMRYHGRNEAAGHVAVCFSIPFEIGAVVIIARKKRFATSARQGCLACPVRRPPADAVRPVERHAGGRHNGGRAISPPCRLPPLERALRHERRTGASARWTYPPYLRRTPGPLCGMGDRQHGGGTGPAAPAADLAGRADLLCAGRNGDESGRRQPAGLAGGHQ